MLTTFANEKDIAQKLFSLDMNNANLCNNAS